MLKDNLDTAMSVFVGGDLLWYPVEGRLDIRRAPDVLVALGTRLARLEQRLRSPGAEPKAK